MYEVAVAFRSFRNLDLHHQGAYSLRARVTGGVGVSLAYHSWPEDAPEATSHHLQSSPSASRKPPATLLDDTYTTSQMMLRYVDEEILLHSGCQFRADAKADELTIEFDLVFASQAVDTVRFRLQHLDDSPVLIFLPVQFEGRYASVAEVVIAVALMAERPVTGRELISCAFEGLQKMKSELVSTSVSEDYGASDNFQVSATSVFELWIGILRTLFTPTALDNIVKKKRNEFSENERQLQRGSIVREIWVAGDLCVPAEDSSARTHSRVTSALKSSRETEVLLATQHAVNLTRDFYSTVHPVIFDQRYHEDQPNHRELLPDQAHFVVLVHGLQGSSHDLRPLKNSLQSAHPDLIFLLAESNQEVTDDDISIMGKRLGAEISRFLKPYEARGQVGRVSFLAFSLGGLVARASLPYLGKFNDRFHAFMTLSSPHLGYIGNSSKLVEGGLWLMQRWNGEAVALKQLSLSDADHMEFSYIVKLAESGGLDKFRWVFLAGSAQDSYAPFESARIEAVGKADIPVAQYMARNILDGVAPGNLIRIDVHFEIAEKNFDSFIGRAAHIAFLENRKLAHILAHSYGFIFE